ncbi:hypothetical protein AVW09_03095 [Microbacterium sp. T32]|nr:hypothetical protein AVW09_03095 [Microbacterium sp. T32]
MVRALSTIKDAVTIRTGPTDSRRHALTQAQQLYSLRRSIKRCGQAGHKCGGALCARCSGARSGRFRRELYAAVKHQPGTLVSWTATVATTPSAGVRQQWADLLAVIQATTRGGWLARQGIIGTARAVEVARSADGWHVHAHHLAVFRNVLSAENFDTFALTLRSRYLAEADRLGIPASSYGQDIARTRSAHAWTHYLDKGGIHPDGNDTASQLWTAVLAGDADALHLAHELEAGAYRRRMWTTTGVCRPVPDFDALVAAGALD